MIVTDKHTKPEPGVEWKETSSESNDDLGVGEQDGHVTYKTIFAVIVSIESLTCATRVSDLSAVSYCDVRGILGYASKTTFNNILNKVLTDAHESR